VRGLTQEEAFYSPDQRLTDAYAPPLLRPEYEDQPSSDAYAPPSPSPSTGLEIENFLSGINGAYTSTGLTQEEAFYSPERLAGGQALQRAQDEQIAQAHQDSERWLLMQDSERRLREDMERKMQESERRLREDMDRKVKQITPRKKTEMPRSKKEGDYRALNDTPRKGVRRDNARIELLGRIFAALDLRGAGRMPKGQLRKLIALMRSRCSSSSRAVASAFPTCTPCAANILCSTSPCVTS